MTSPVKFAHTQRSPTTSAQLYYTLVMVCRTFPPPHRLTSSSPKRATVYPPLIFYNVSSFSFSILTWDILY